MNQLAKAIEKVMHASGSPVLTVKDVRTLDGLPSPPVGPIHSPHSRPQRSGRKDGGTR